MSKSVEFQQTPLWYPNTDSVEFVLNETNFVEFVTETISSFLFDEYESEVEWFRLFNDLNEGIKEYGEVCLNMGRFKR